MIDRIERYEMIKQAHQKVMRGQKFRAKMKALAKAQKGYDDEPKRTVKNDYVGENDYMSEIVKDSNLPEVEYIKETYRNTVKYDNVWS